MLSLLGGWWQVRMLISLELHQPPISPKLASNLHLHNTQTIFLFTALYRVWRRCVALSQGRRRRVRLTVLFLGVMRIPGRDAQGRVRLPRSSQSSAARLGCTAVRWTSRQQGARSREPEAMRTLVW